MCIHCPRLQQLYQYILRFIRLSIWSHVVTDIIYTTVYWIINLIGSWSHVVTDIIYTELDNEQGYQFNRHYGHKY